MQPSDTGYLAQRITTHEHVPIRTFHWDEKIRMHLSRHLNLYARTDLQVNRYHQHGCDDNDLHLSLARPI